MDTKNILSKYKNIAIVGFSDNKEKPAHYIPVYLSERNYNIYGINPKLKGRVISGITCYGALDELNKNVDIINIFRISSALPGIVNEIIHMQNKPSVIWAQLGIRNQEAKKLAETNKFVYIEDTCIYVEYKKLMGF